jgi:hypothetical protein
MAKIYLSINGDKVGSKISEAVKTNDPEQVREASFKFNNAHLSIDKWVESSGGRIISASGDEGVYEIEDSKLGELEGIVQNYQNQTGHTLSAGVGPSMLESVKAMIYSKMHDPGQIIEYDSEVESAISPQEESEAEEMAGEESEMETSEDDEELESDELGEDEESEFDTGEDDEAQPMGDEDLEEDEELEEDDEFEEDEDPSAEMEESDEDEESVTIPKDEFVDEHEDLIDTLESPEHEDDLEEADDQQAELDEVEGEESDELSGETGQLEDEDDLEAQPEMEGDLEGGESELPELSEDDLASPEDDMEMEDEFEDEDMDEESEDGEESPILDMVHANAEEPMDEMGEEEPMDESDMMTPDEAMPMEDESEGDPQLKQRVIDTLMNFKQNKDKIQAMQQTDPQTYQSVMDMINSMIEMAKELSIDPEQGVAAQEGLEEIPEEEGMSGVNEDVGEVAPKKPLGRV